jgi:hypothetical protein
MFLTTSLDALRARSRAKVNLTKVLCQGHLYVETDIADKGAMIDLNSVRRSGTCSRIRRALFSAHRQATVELTERPDKEWA